MSKCLVLKPACIVAGDSYVSEITVQDSAGADATATGVDYQWLRRGASTAAISLDETDTEVDVTTAGKVTVTLATGDTNVTAGTYDVEIIVETSGGFRTARQVVTVEARL